MGISTYRVDRKIRWLLFSITLIGFPIALLVVAFSSCDIRMRSEKAACRHGDVERCLEVGRFYEARSDGLIGFLMSNADTAVASYYRACALRSPVGCERMVEVRAHADQAKNASIDPTEVADALIDACIARVAGGCDQLFKLADEGDWVDVRSANAFERQCTAGEPWGCYMLARMHVLNLGNRHNVIDQVIPLYDKACAGGIADGCTGAQRYRAEQAKRAGSASPAEAPYNPAEK